MTRKSQSRLVRSKSACSHDQMADDEVTPTVPQPTIRGTRLGSIFHQSASLFENSPFFSIGDATGDEGEENRRSVKAAFYNTAFLVFVGVIFYTCVQVFYIFEFCIRPLFWALMLGAVLYPLKEMGKQLILFSIDTLENSGAPLLLGLILLPLLSIQRLLIWIAGVTTRTYKEMIIAMFILITIFLTDMIDFIDTSNDIAMSISYYANIALEALEQYSYIVLTGAVAYLIFVCLWWQPDTMQYVEILGIPVWVLTIATLISYLGQWRDLIAICVFGILGCGTYAALTKKYNKKTEPEESNKPLVNKHILISDHQPASSSTPILSSTRKLPTVTPLYTKLAKSNYTTPVTNIKNKTRFHTPGTTRPLIDARKVSQKFLEQGNKTSTVRYFSVLGWSVAFTLIGRDIFLVLRVSSFLLFFIILYKLYKWLTSWQELTNWLHSLCSKVRRVAGKGQKYKALRPPSLRGLGILMKHGQNFLLDILRKSTNQVVSASIIILMLLSISLAAFFIFYTVHSEILYILQASSYFINNHIQTSQHLQNLNTSAWSIGLSSVHSAGRGWIKTKIGLLPEGNSTSDLESTLLSLYDNMYEQWVHRNISTTRTNVTFNHLISTVKGNMDSLDGLFSLNTAKSNLVHLLSGKCSDNPSRGTFLANYILCSKGMLVDVVNSLWSIISSNMAVVLQLSFSFMSGVLESGAAFLNFLLQTAVFVTALYYLLLYSDEYYAPVEFITSLLPASVDKVEYTSVFFEATRGIFGASLKLSVFYGCYVWVTHTVFGLEMVFLPALIAGVLSVIPVIGVYWSSVPGFLVLWLVDGRTLRAFVFLFLQILPTYFIDMAVYSELEGAWHPYITGLAVAGGICYFGLEGAFIGPLVICILKFTINIYECVHENLSTKTKLQ